MIEGHEEGLLDGDIKVEAEIMEYLDVPFLPLVKLVMNECFSHTETKQCENHQRYPKDI